jgi:hypothetical protein
MPNTRWTAPSGAVDLAGRQVLLGWCGPGVVLFRTVDTDNDELVYCGISDRGRTDAFLDRVLTMAEEPVARALTRRLREMFPGAGAVNPRLVLDAVRERLRRSIRGLIEDTLNTLCAQGMEISLAALFDAFRRRLWDRKYLDVLVDRFAQPLGAGMTAQDWANVRSGVLVVATGVTVGAIVWAVLSGLTLAF